MLVNATITIFNRYPDRLLKRMIYVPHVVDQAWFHVNQKSMVGDKGLSSADEYLIRIPYSECRDWVAAYEFKNLSSPGRKWTVQNGDIFLVGRWESGKVYTIEEVRKEFSGVVGMILSHSENFFGSSRHIRIGGGS